MEKDESMIGRLVSLHFKNKDDMIALLLVHSIINRGKESFAILYTFDERQSKFYFPLDMLLKQSSQDIIKIHVRKKDSCGCYTVYGNTKIFYYFDEDKHVIKFKQIVRFGKEILVYHL
jgi:hypothetical protein